MTILPTNASTNITDMRTYFSWVSETSSGVFFPSVLFGVFIILFMMFRSSQTNGKAFLGASFLCMIFSVMLSVLGWLSPSYMYVAIVLTALGGAWAWLDDSSE